MYGDVGLRFRFGGNDSLDGGSGDNHYLPGVGHDSITGGAGLDVVFLDLNKAAVNKTDLSQLV